MMLTITRRYMMQSVLSATLVITVLLMGLQIFILFASELNDIGRGDYSAGHALLFALLQMPLRLYQFFPVASLVGSVVGLGILASHNELMVMRASGLGVRQIVGAVLSAALLLIIVMTAVGEWVAPEGMRWAEAHKAKLISGGQVLPTRRGLWLRDQQQFVHIGTMTPEGIISSVTRYQFDDQLQLTYVEHAKQGHFQAGAWQMQTIAATHLTEQQVTRQHHAQAVWHLPLNPLVLQLTSLAPEEMSTQQLFQYIEQSPEQTAQTNRYALAFWQRLFQPLATMVMMLLAVPFIMGSLRTASLGARLLTGIAVGFAFHLLHRFLGPVSLVYQLPAYLAAGLPIILFALMAALMLRKV